MELVKGNEGENLVKEVSKEVAKFAVIEVDEGTKKMLQDMRQSILIAQNQINMILQAYINARGLGNKKFMASQNFEVLTEVTQ